MYALLFISLFGIGIALLISGLVTRRGARTAIGAGVVVGALLLLYLLNFWVEMLWFEHLGYGSRFWTAFFTRVLSAVIAAALGAGLTALITRRVPRRRRHVRGIATVLGGLLGFFFGAANWQDVLIFLNRVSPDTRDPILQRSTGFYMFALPLLNTAGHLVVLLTAMALLATLFAVFVEGRRPEDLTFRVPERESEQSRSGEWNMLYLPLGALLLAGALKLYLQAFGLMYSTAGVVTGPGWTDVHVRLPVYRTAAFLAGLSGLVLLVPWFRRRLRAAVARFTSPGWPRQVAALLTLPLLPAALLLLGLGVAAPMLQWLRVEPNEITLEKPYIEHNIRFTRAGFNLENIEATSFSPSEDLERETVAQNRDVLSETRLWDWRALKSVYRQFQEIRLYYTLNDVDVDRYHIDGRYRQVMVSPREMDLGALPEKSQTFVNRRFKYTHGYGMTMSLVSEFTEAGLPRLLVRDIPPVSTHPSLEVEVPQIYYGTVPNQPAVVNSREEEFDYPRGDSNVYTHYAGSGGIQLKNLWRKFVLGPKVGGTRFFLSRYPKKDSRVMLYRNVRQRVKHLAPFLRLDTDPYIVLSEGKLWWLLDAYTVSSHYPYSEQFLPYTLSAETQRQGISSARDIPEEVRHIRGVNYVRNSVKVVIDAYTGAVSFYVFDPTDPVLQVWRNVFPDLFRDRDAMPAELQAHVRYPVAMLLIQGLVYAQYHMDNPEVFYNQEDLWMRATEKYYSQVQPVEPYYIMWKLPEEQNPEFSLILPFTPKNKQVLIGWLAGLCDGDNYGRLLAYKLPKERRVLGPQQVETKIDQDRFLSGQLSLWDQRGSRVIRGNLLVLPIGDTLLYVEPIYLRADTAAYPELRLVAVMHNDNLSYAQSFDAALEGLFDEDARPDLAKPGTAAAAAAAPREVDDLIEAAGEALNDYIQAMGEKRFEAAGRAFSRLSEAVEGLRSRSREGREQDRDAAADQPLESGIEP